MLVKDVRLPVKKEEGYVQFITVVLMRGYFDDAPDVLLERP